MKSADLKRPTVPVVYGLLILELARQHGVSDKALLEGLQVPESCWNEANARLSLLQTSTLLYRLMKLSGNPALGYEIALHSTLTTHGFITYGVMSFNTWRQGMEFGCRFLPLRLPNLRMRLVTDGVCTGLEAAETTPQGAVRQVVFDLFLVGLWRIAQHVLAANGMGSINIELWFDYPQPEYYARYRDRLPPMRFGMGSNQVRFPTMLMDLPLRTASPVTAELVQRQCEQELTVLGLCGDFLSQVREALLLPKGGYCSLEQLAVRLHLSSRTLKRRLREHRVNFQGLLDEVRRQDSLRLLRDSSLRVKEVADRMAYADPANFTRAFRKWTGRTPSAFRAELAAQGESHGNPLG
jgi:AraC-like DNA-binding protein